MYVYLNGEFVDQSEAKVSVFDHGFLYGDGAFEGIRSYILNWASISTGCMQQPSR